MKQELLKEFLIKEHGMAQMYTVTATDKAYELLNLSSKTTVKHKIPIDTIEPRYYIAALLHFLDKNYEIDAIVRTSKGNSHDASWQKEITIFKTDGPWQDKLEKLVNEKSDCYSRKPIIKTESAVTPAIIDSWSKFFDLDGEGEDDNGRYILCSPKGAYVRYCFYVCTSRIVCTADSPIYTWYKTNNPTNTTHTPQPYATIGVCLHGRVEYLQRGTNHYVSR